MAQVLSPVGQINYKQNKQAIAEILFSYPATLALASIGSKMIFPSVFNTALNGLIVALQNHHKLFKRALQPIFLHAVTTLCSVVHLSITLSATF
jgi:hypothetical protein